MSFASSRSPRAVLVCALVLALISACSQAAAPNLTTVSTSLYARADTNATTVWSPRVRVAGPASEAVAVEAVYTLDAWTGASIDVVTAATQAIHEVRQEISAGVRGELDDVTLSGSYRYSTEYDYWSHGGVATLGWDVADKNTNLALSIFGSGDTVGRAHDPDFRRPQWNLGARLSITQVLDRQSLAQLAWESSYVEGYQASPYRFVAIGSPGTCAGQARFCVPEQVPEQRVRHALIARVRRAIGDALSAGLEYRYYVDSWGLQSQTLAPELTWLVSEQGTLSFQYRYYTQREAEFYRPRYLGAPEQYAYVTRDRELSAFYVNRLGFSYMHELALGSRLALNAALRAGVMRYRYLAFVGLTRVDALEATFFLSLDVR